MCNKHCSNYDQFIQFCNQFFEFIARVVRCILFFILFVNYSYLFSIKKILLVLIKTPDWVQAMTSKRFYFQETEEELAEAEEYKEARTVLDSVKLEG